LMVTYTIGPFFSYRTFSSFKADAGELMVFSSWCRDQSKLH
jgi:hypothetical protein